MLTRQLGRLKAAGCVSDEEDKGSPKQGVGVRKQLRSCVLVLNGIGPGIAPCILSGVICHSEDGWLLQHRASAVSI